MPVLQVASQTPHNLAPHMHRRLMVHLIPPLLACLVHFHGASGKRIVHRAAVRFSTCTKVWDVCRWPPRLDGFGSLW